MQGLNSEMKRERESVSKSFIPEYKFFHWAHVIESSLIHRPKVESTLKQCWFRVVCLQGCSPIDGTPTNADLSTQNAVSDQDLLGAF